jgi:hypothetical protein
LLKGVLRELLLTEDMEVSVRPKIGNVKIGFIFNLDLPLKSIAVVKKFRVSSCDFVDRPRFPANRNDPRTHTNQTRTKYT